MARKPYTIPRREERPGPSSNRGRDSNKIKRPFFSTKKKRERTASTTTYNDKKNNKFKKWKRNKDDKRKEDKGKSIPFVVHQNVTNLSQSKDFIHAYEMGCFSFNTIQMIESSGLSLNNILQTASLPIAGRLQLRLEYWKQITSNNWALSVVGNGLQFNWKTCPPTTTHRRDNPPADKIARDILDKEIDTMIMKGAIQEVPHTNK